MKIELKKDSNYTYYTIYGGKNRRRRATVMLNLSTDLFASVELVYLYVSPESRNKGYGTLLMKRVIKDFGNKYISVFAEGSDEGMNQRRLCNFYRRFGFKSDQKNMRCMAREAS